MGTRPTGREALGQFPCTAVSVDSSVVEKGLEHIVSWQPHGRAFRVHKPLEFAKIIMPRFFGGQTKYASFQRQLNLYGYSRFAHGIDKGAYYHSCMIRGNPKAVQGMVRRKIKGTSARRRLSPDEEPDFYRLPFAYHGDADFKDNLKLLPREVTKNNRGVENLSLAPSTSQLLDDHEPAPVSPQKDLLTDIVIDPYILRHMTFKNAEEDKIQSQCLPLLRFETKLYQTVTPSITEGSLDIEPTPLTLFDEGVSGEPFDDLSSFL